MADLVSITLPIFLLIGLGFAAVKVGVVSPDFIRGLGVFVLNFAMPALILHALLSQDFGSAFNGRYLLAYAAGSVAVFLPVLLLFRFLLGRPGEQAAIAALGAGVSNSGFIGFPVVSMAVGSAALLAFPVALLVELSLIIPLSLALAEISVGTASSRWGIVRGAIGRLARMPIFSALIVGTILAVLDVKLPLGLGRAVELLANASTACALFTVGGTLAGIAVAIITADLAWIVVAKLLLHPAAVAAFIWLVGGVPADLAAAGIIMAACPMLSAYPIFAGRFGLGPMAAATVLAATVVSFVTLTIAVGIAR